jgi:hypothetical protein
MVTPATPRVPLSQGERKSSSRLLGRNRRHAGKRRGESKQKCARRPRSQPPWRRRSATASLALPDEAAAASPVRDVAARHIVTHTRTAGSEQRGSEASRLLLVRSGHVVSCAAGYRSRRQSSDLVLPKTRVLDWAWVERCFRVRAGRRQSRDGNSGRRGRVRSGRSSRSHSSAGVRTGAAGPRERKCRVLAGLAPGRRSARASATRLWEATAVPTDAGVLRARRLKSHTGATARFSASGGAVRSTPTSAFSDNRLCRGAETSNQPPPPFVTDATVVAASLNACSGASNAVTAVMISVIRNVLAAPPAIS